MQHEEDRASQLDLVRIDPRVDIDYLRKALGANFVSWVLGPIEESLNTQQTEVAGALHRALSSPGPDLGRSPGDQVMSYFSRYVPEVRTIALNLLRSHATGQAVVPPEPSGNELVDVLRTMASEVYGLLLLRSYHGDGSYFAFSFDESGLSRRLFDALSREKRLSRFVKDRRTEEVKSLDTENFLLNGYANNFAYGIVTASWALCKFDNEVPQIENLWSCIESTLEKTRSLLANNVVSADFVASLTGITVSGDSTSRDSTLRIRPTRVADRPYFIEQQMSHRIGTTTTDGRHIEISDAGDVILRSAIPLRILWDEGGDGSFKISSHFPEFELEEYLEDVRLALILAIEREIPPVSVVVWYSCLVPFASPMYPHRDPQLFAPRTPIELREAEVSVWLQWIERIRGANLRKLRIATTRLLRASTERRDPFDMLVDSVIVWESIFGARGGDVTLRVTSCIAKLLCTDGDERRKIQANLTGLYDTRSGVVHGVNVDRQKVEKASQEALRVAISLMRILIEERKDLLNLDSQNRSIRVLLEDGHVNKR